MMRQLTKAERVSLEKYRDAMNAGLQAQYGAADQAILTLSSAGLGVSLAFLKNVQVIERWSVEVLLVPSWIAFGVAILMTIYSFRLSIMAHKERRDFARDHLKSGIAEEFVSKHAYAEQTDYLNLFALLLFSAAVILTIAFVAINHGAILSCAGGSGSA